MRNFFGVFGLIWKLYIAVVFGIFALLFYPFFLVLIMRPQWKKISFKLFIVWSWLMRIFCFYRVRVMEKATLPQGPYIIVANHTSYLDIFLLHSILPESPFVFLGKSEILKYPILGTYFKNLNIPVYRNNKSKAGQAYSMANKAVEEGWSIVIFPEGTIPDHQCPKMIPFKDGAFKMAKTMGIPLLPLTFTNNYKLFSDPTDILGPAQPGISRVYIHPFFTVEELSQMEISEIREACFNRINAPILSEYPHLFDENK